VSCIGGYAGGTSGIRGPAGNTTICVTVPRWRRRVSSCLSWELVDCQMCQVICWQWFFCLSCLCCHCASGIAYLHQNLRRLLVLIASLGTHKHQVEPRLVGSQRQNIYMINHSLDSVLSVVTNVCSGSLTLANEGPGNRCDLGIYYLYQHTTTRVALGKLLWMI